MTEASTLPAISVFRCELGALRSQLMAVLPPGVTPEAFQRVTLSAVQQQPELLEANRRSLFGAVMKCAQDQLLPDGREAALVLFGKPGARVAVYMPMVAGLLKRLHASGQLESIAAHVVHAGDVFEYSLGSTPRILHQPTLGNERGQVIAAYAIARTRNGGTYIELLTRADIDQVRAASRAGESGPWVDWFDEMARKTALRRLAKRLPSRVEFASIIDAEPAGDRDPDERRVEIEDPHEYLRGARTVDELDGRWKQVVRQASGEIALPLEALYHDRRESLEQAAGRAS